MLGLAMAYEYVPMIADVELHAYEATTSFDAYCDLIETKIQVDLIRSCHKSGSWYILVNEESSESSR